MANGIFITGTDTGIGKTIASCAVMHELAKQGHKVAGMKPIASGACLQDGQLQNEDALALIQHANISVDYQQVNPYCFEPAIAPHIAAEQANVDIDMSIIQESFAELAKQVDWVVVEGVGGWLVPINKKQVVADIALELQLPVILVVGLRLGCINHALLTMESMRSKGVNIMGWIANQIAPNLSATDRIIKTLQNKLNSHYLGFLPYFEKGIYDPGKIIDLKLPKKTD